MLNELQAYTCGFLRLLLSIEGILSLIRTSVVARSENKAFEEFPYTNVSNSTDQQETLHIVLILLHSCGISTAERAQKVTFFSIRALTTLLHFRGKYLLNQIALKS